MKYERLTASGDCGYLGSTVSTATVPLQPSLVSSVGINGLETQVNFADLTNCTTKPASITVNSMLGFDIPNNYDFCHPSLRYDIYYLSTMQPEWATCVQGGQIIYDPPSALTPVSALNGPGPPATITQAASPSLVHSASPGAHFPQAPPLTNLPTRPSKPKQAQIDPAGRDQPTSTVDPGAIFKIGPQSVDGKENKGGGTPVTVDGAGFSLGPSEFIVGDKSETFAPATPDPLGEVGRIKGGAGQGIAAGLEGIGSAQMSGLGAVGEGAAIHSAGQGSDGNVSLMAPSLGTASKTCGDDANLWLRIGLGLLVFVCVVTRTN